MARLELWTTVLAGLAGGLAGVLWSGLVTTPWLARGAAAAGAPAETAARLLAGAVLRAAAGAALGLLFWLGWGLIAIIGWPWWGVGLAFGALAWSAAAAPALATLQLHGAVPARPVAAHATEWLFTCLAAGLLCAYAWQRYA
jgi:hypothetical protein